MARRNDHSREELRINILAATHAIVARDGFERLNARKIAAEIGYTIGTLYQAFENLDDIILHVNAETLSMLETQIAALKGDKPEKAVELYLRFMERETARWQMLALHSIPGSVLPGWYRARVEACFAALATYLKPSLGKHAPETARVLWVSIQGISQLSFQGKLAAVGIADAKPLIKNLSHYYIKGIA